MPADSRPACLKSRGAIDTSGKSVILDLVTAEGAIALNVSASSLRKCSGYRFYALGRIVDSAPAVPLWPGLRLELVQGEPTTLELWLESLTPPLPVTAYAEVEWRPWWPSPRPQIAILDSERWTDRDLQRAGQALRLLWDPQFLSAIALGRPPKPPEYQTGEDYRHAIRKRVIDHFGSTLAKVPARSIYQQLRVTRHQFNALRKEYGITLADIRQRKV